jgi:predicted NAD/FAD-dependent oxidoreductase
MPAVVFDTGEHGVGGRAATRTTADRSIRPDWLAAAVSDGGVGGSAGASSSLRDAGLLFDHAAQCFTATAPAFKQQCEEWEAAGVVRRWAPHAVGVLAPGGRFSPLSPASPVYVAAGGMRALAEHMSRCVAGSSGGSTRVVAPMWVSKMAASQAAGGWRLTGAGRDQGTFGAVVVAHNGKCANRCARVARSATWLRGAVRHSAVQCVP